MGSGEQVTDSERRRALEAWDNAVFMWRVSDAASADPLHSEEYKAVLHRASVGAAMEAVRKLGGWRYSGPAAIALGWA